MSVGDTLDLHTFRPSDVKELVPDYLDECVATGLRRVRIIHGKGKGTLRRIVHAALEKHASVVGYSFDSATGNWGATVVELALAEEAAPEGREE